MEGPTAAASSAMGGRAAAAAAKPPASTTTTTTTDASSFSTSTRKQTVSVAAAAAANMVVKVDPTLCRNYALRGSCRFGNRCNFLHILPNDCQDWNEACQRIPCPHYRIGLCRYGTMCRLAHVGEDDNNVDENKRNVSIRPDSARTDAQSQKAGATGKGSSTEKPHGKRDDDTISSKLQDDEEGVDESNNEDEDDDDDDDDQKPPARLSSKNKETKAGVVAKTDEEEEDDDDDMVCGICLEPLGRSIPVEEDGTEGNDNDNNGRAMTMTATSQRKKFGLLTCNHIFCIDCLRHWRKEQKKEASENNGYGEVPQPTGSDRVRACPSCRQVSDFVVPSDRFCIGAEKDQVVASYQARLSCISCQRFNGRLGSCPFGRDCFYAHRHPQRGHDMKLQDKSKQELWEEKQRRKNQQQQQQRIHIDGLGTFTRMPDFNGVPHLRFDYPALLAGIEDGHLLDSDNDEDEDRYSPSRYSAGRYARATNRGSRGPGDGQNVDGNVHPPSGTHTAMTARRSNTGNRSSQANNNRNRNSNGGGGPSMRANYHRNRNSGIQYEGGSDPLPPEFEAQLLHAFRRHMRNVALMRQRWAVEDPDV